MFKFTTYLICVHRCRSKTSLQMMCFDRYILKWQSEKLLIAECGLGLIGEKMEVM